MRSLAASAVPLARANASTPFRGGYDQHLLLRALARKLFVFSFALTALPLVQRCCFFACVCLHAFWTVWRVSHGCRTVVARLSHGVSHGIACCKSISAANSARMKRNSKQTRFLRTRELPHSVTFLRAPAPLRRRGRRHLDGCKLLHTRARTHQPRTGHLDCGEGVVQ